MSVIVEYAIIRGIDYLTSSAIDMLPRTLATIGKSLMKQTGWNISILAGGPMPDTDGTILTYLYVSFF